MSQAQSPRKRRPADDTGRSPLLLIIVLVYVVFFATAAASIIFFFPETTLPRQLQIKDGNLSRLFSGISDRLTARSESKPSPPVRSRRSVTDILAPVAIKIGDTFRGLTTSAHSVWQRLRVAVGTRKIIPRLRERDAAQEPVAEVSVAEDQLEDLRIRLLASTEEINQVAARLIQMIEAGDLPEDERSRNIAGVKQRAQSLRTDAERDYMAQIGAKEGQVAVLQRELAARVVEPTTRAQPTTTARDDTVPSDRLVRIESDHKADIERIQSAHAKKEAELQRQHEVALENLRAQYNPRFESDNLKEILGRPAVATSTAEPPPYRSVLRDEAASQPHEYEELTRQAEDLEVLTDRLLAVPYSGSVPVALERIRDAGRILSQGYGEMWSVLADRLEERTETVQATREELTQQQTEVKRVHEAVDRLARDTRENGYVLDPYDSQNILLHISRLHAPSVGDLVFVFHEDDRMVATLLITTAGDAVRARLLQLADDGRPVRAFDKLLLSVETNG